MMGRILLALALSITVVACELPGQTKNGTEGAAGSTASPVSTPLPAASMTPTAAARPTPTPRPTPAATPTPTPRPLSTPTPTPRSSPTPSPTPTPTPSVPAVITDLARALDAGDCLPPLCVGLPYYLGTLPGSMTATWPTAPTPSRTIEVRSAADFNYYAETGDYRMDVNFSSQDALVIRGSNLEINVRAGMRLGNLLFERGVRRVAITGGQFNSIELMAPHQYWPSFATNTHWFVEDVLLNRIVVFSSTGSALTLRGRRIAVVRSTITARHYSLWFGDHAPQQAQNVIVAGNTMASGGDEATLRIHDADNVFVVGNTLTNGNASDALTKHNLRLHGTMNQAFIARNVLNHSGAMCAIPDSGDTDVIGRLYFHQNQFYQRRPSLFRVEAAQLAYLETRGNRVYSNIHNCFMCLNPIPQSWSVDSTPISPLPAQP